MTPSAETGTKRTLHGETTTMHLFDLTRFVQVQAVLEVILRLFETQSINGQPAVGSGGELSAAALGALEQARTAVVLAGHLVADKV